MISSKTYQCLSSSALTIRDATVRKLDAPPYLDRLSCRCQRAGAIDERSAEQSGRSIRRHRGLESTRRTAAWDANYQLVQDNYSLYRILMALDSVTGPNGQPECRVTADGFAGAVAANPFGTQPLSQAAINYASSNLLEQLRYEQTDANVNFLSQ